MAFLLMSGQKLIAPHISSRGLSLHLSESTSVTTLIFTLQLMLLFYGSLERKPISAQLLSIEFIIKSYVLKTPIMKPEAS